MSEENKTMEVNFGGFKIVLPEEQAKQVIAARDSQTSSYNELKAQIETRAASEAAAVLRAKTEEEGRLAFESAKAGEFDTLKNFHASELKQRDTELLKVSIQAALGTRKDIVSTAIADATTMLSAEGKLVREGGKIMHKSDAGILTSFDAYVKTWLESRPHYQASGIPKKATDDNEKPIPADVEVILRSEYDKNPRRYAAKAAAGKIIFKD